MLSMLLGMIIPRKPAVRPPKKNENVNHNFHAKDQEKFLLTTAAKHMWIVEWNSYFKLSFHPFFVVFKLQMDKSQGQMWRWIFIPL